MSNLFAPVQRQKMKLRMALTGVSGGGKTLGALYLAYGLTDDWGKVALIDTERERGRAYASRSDLPIPTGEYLYAGLYAPYSPERYKEYVRQAAEAVGPGRRGDCGQPEPRMEQRGRRAGNKGPHCGTGRKKQLHRVE